MKLYYYTFCIICTALFLTLAVYSYQQATSMTLGEFIDRKLEQHAREKMEQLYAGAYE